MFDRRVWRSLVGLIVVFALGPGLSNAADPPPRASKDEDTSRTRHADQADVEVDDELLEFLGSVDAEEDAELVDYLVKTDASAPNKPASAPTASRAGSTANKVTQKTNGKNE